MVTGVSGQDGSYLAELLLDKGYTVHGAVRQLEPEPGNNLTAVRDRLTLHVTDLTDADQVDSLVRRIQPHEIYNLAAPSLVYASWDDPGGTVSWMSAATIALLEAVRGGAPEARVFQASSSEIFRGATTSPQDERTPPAPCSPYGAGKLLAQSLVNAYRARYDLHLSCGILFNHESPRRPLNFVTRKIVNGAVAVKTGAANELVLGDLSAQRDWGYAKDYVEAMWLMLQQDEGGDFVLATGVLHTVEDLVRLAFERVDLDYREYVRSDPALLRTGDETAIVGNPSKAREVLGWKAATGFESLVALMVEAESNAITKA